MLSDLRGAFTPCPRSAHALSRGAEPKRWSKLANDYAHTYAPYIRAAVREVGQNYRQVANWLTRERIPPNVTVDGQHKA